DTVNITAACQCRAASYTFAVSTSSLPLSTYLCHCNISRRISGLLCTSYVPIPSQNNAPPDLSALTAYPSSSTVTRYFCSTCGTHLFLHHTSSSSSFSFSVSTGSLDRSAGIVNFKGHMHIEPTLDGGASDWIPSIGAAAAQRWLGVPGESQAVPSGWRGVEVRGTRPTSSEKLHAYCHCRGVEFYITRPNKESRNAASPFPDLLVPYNSSSVGSSTNVPWWIPHEAPHCFLAGTCACTSCRLSSGFDFVAWAFVPASNIFQADGQPFSIPFGSMKTFASSKNVVRTFCAKCGAGVFYTNATRPTIVDVHVGSLDAESGVRAEKWLKWETRRVSFAEEGMNEELMEGLKDGLRGWGRR
ncbi:hypothetical protein K402DRAFT_311313, partial [Aulographum hederae CBS 113979]